MHGNLGTEKVIGSRLRQASRPLPSLRNLQRMHIVAGLTISLTLGAAAMAPHAWLDAAVPIGWNSAGAAIAAAPPWRIDGRVVPGGKDPELLRGGRCASSVRGAATGPERIISTHGWLIARVVPALPSGTDPGGISIVMGISGADGMCRPLGYQLFAFRGGRYIGTLSPELMDARADASFEAVRLTGPTTLQVDFLRYAESDPLCCPHATTRVWFAIAGGSRPRIVPVSVHTKPNSG
jgi:hypothetical protein